MKRVVKENMPKSKLGILKAGAELMAERGVDGVTVREITERAKANVAAVNYHFGSREGLEESLLEMHLLPLWEERKMRLEAAEGKWGSKAIPLEELLDMWVRPVVAAARRSVLGEVVGLRMTGRVMMMEEWLWPAEVRVLCVPVRERWQKALVRVLPGVGAEEVGWRVDWLAGGLARMLCQEWGDREAGVALDRVDTVCAAFVRYAGAGLRAGVHELEEEVEVGEEVVGEKKKRKAGQATFDF